MKFSVIMPCHNASAWITDALVSADAQLYQPHEIIVIDDASTDDSLVKIAKSGIDVKILHTNYRNAAAARAHGIAQATGDWIAFLDADDIWYPHHLQRARDMLQNTDDVGFLANH